MHDCVRCRRRNSRKSDSMRVVSPILTHHKDMISYKILATNPLELQEIVVQEGNIYHKPENAYLY
jgi:hypothetical protein